MGEEIEEREDKKKRRKEKEEREKVGQESTGSDSDLLREEAGDVRGRKGISIRTI